MAHEYPWRVLATVFSLLAVALAGLVAGILTGSREAWLIAAGAGGALGSYMGKVNGAG